MRELWTAHLDLNALAITSLPDGAQLGEALREAQPRVARPLPQRQPHMARRVEQVEAIVLERAAYP